MSISALFEELGAPLHNRMWSWGAVRESDKAVFLRVWQDGTQKKPELGGRYYTWVSAVADTDHSLGAAERRRHVALIREEGYKPYLIMCVADDDEAETRSIREFDDKEIRVGGKVVELAGELLIENVGRIAVQDAKVRVMG